MADLITVSVASMLNTSRATAASAMLRVSQEENLRGAGISFGVNWWGAGILILLAQIGGRDPK
jgi:hypothetical protein